MSADKGPDRWAVGLSEGATGKGVVALQKFLRRYGYIPPHEAPEVRGLTAQEGLFDAATTSAIRDYQNLHRLPATGILDEATAAMMSRPRCGVPDTFTIERASLV